jgi:hypothetical protein
MPVKNLNQNHFDFLKKAKIIFLGGSSLKVKGDHLRQTPLFYLY